MIIAAAAVLLSACTSRPEGTTRLSGKFSEEPAPGTVQVVVGSLDTTVAVAGVKFSVDVPMDVTAVAYIVADAQMIPFVSDGSVLKVDFDNETITSSDKHGIQSRMAELLQWEADFEDNYMSLLENVDNPVMADAISDSLLLLYDAHLEEVARANNDNVVGVYAITEMQGDEDAAKMLELLNGLADNMKAIPAVGKTIESYQSVLATGEGSMFMDFEVVQDPENPAASTVRLSDYVGRGKYVIVDFWASWCGPCREEVPYLKAVYQQYKGKRFDMLSVAVSDLPANSKAAAEQLGITWNQIVNAQRIPGEIYGIRYIPHIILFGPDGTILRRGLRGDDIAVAVAEALAQ